MIKRIRFDHVIRNTSSVCHLWRNIKYHSYYCTERITMHYWLKLHQLDGLVEKYDGLTALEKSKVPDISYENAKMHFEINNSNAFDTTTQKETEPKRLFNGLIRNLVSIVNIIHHPPLYLTSTYHQHFVFNYAGIYSLRRTWIRVKRESHPEAFIVLSKTNCMVYAIHGLTIRSEKCFCHPLEWRWLQLYTFKLNPASNET